MTSQKMTDIIKPGKKLLVGYLLAGYPTLDSFLDLLDICNEYFDILEIGYPSYNPFADGKVISEAHAAVDTEAARGLDYWEKIRDRFNGPIWLMAYHGDYVLSDNYLSFAKAGLIDAIVIPDATYEQKNTMADEMNPFGVEVVRFTNPAMDKNTMKAELESGSIIYEQLYVGQTGDASRTGDEFIEMLNYSKQFSNDVTFGGFGISTADRVRHILDSGFDGAIVGSELLRRINISTDSFIELAVELRKAV